MNIGGIEDSCQTGSGVGVAVGEGTGVSGRGLCATLADGSGSVGVTVVTATLHAATVRLIVATATVSRLRPPGERDVETFRIRLFMPMRRSTPPDATATILRLMVSIVSPTIQSGGSSQEIGCRGASWSVSPCTGDAVGIELVT